MSGIQLHNVCVDYTLKTGSDSLKRTLLQLSRHLLGRHMLHEQTVWHTSLRALDNITLTINQHDRIGVLGRNGAGKSTLLRVLAGIYQPHVGRISSQGKISSLFDVSLGMCPEASGYENIVNLAVLRGFTPLQAKTTFENIAHFTELNDALAQPIRTYSDGMRLKLAFAVATAFPSDILLIDEIIGVGDNRFRERAVTRLLEMVDASNILVLTSHDHDTIQRFCNKVVVLEQGRVVFQGAVDDGLQYYQKLTA